MIFTKNTASKLINNFLLIICFMSYKALPFGEFMYMEYNDFNTTTIAIKINIKMTNVINFIVIFLIKSSNFFFKI